MNHFFDWLKKTILRQILVILLVELSFFGVQAFNSNNPMFLAQAETVTTPEGVYYKGTPDREQIINGQIRNDQQVEKAQRKLKETADNIRERLNLDEETPEATKEFLESTQRKLQETVEPITGTKRGYYQDNLPPNVSPERVLRDTQK
ncbi:MAG TPA: hypothetical protein VK203_13315 [Nostocaceae cyanobacterium]|nr:hypothetical protein [Nostocaceae cyanobacterium]